jgi:uncharacterized membrane protein
MFYGFFAGWHLDGGVWLLISLLLGGVVAIMVIALAHVPYEILTILLIILCVILSITAIFIGLGNETEKTHPDQSPSIEINHGQISTTNQNLR